MALAEALLETPVAQVSALWRFRVDNRNHLRHAPDLPVEPLRFSVRLLDSTLIAILSGELDIVTAPRMVDHLETYRYRATRILYDLGGLTFLDGFGLRSLLGIFDGDLDGVSIANPSPPVRRVLEALGHGSMIESWSGPAFRDADRVDSGPSASRETSAVPSP